MSAIAASRGRAEQNGSILILVLVVCLALALLVQVMSAVAVCASRAMSDETNGRDRLRDKDEALAAICRRSAADWAPFDWDDMASKGQPVEGALSAIDGSERVMEAAARQGPSEAPATISAWVERGRDGLDLPLAAIVAGSLKVDPGRSGPWLEVDTSCPSSGHETPPAGEDDGRFALATAFLNEMPAGTMVGDGCSVERREDAWRLDSGWAAFVSSQMPEEPGGPGPGSDSAAGFVACGPGVMIARGGNGSYVSLGDLLEAEDRSRLTGRAPGAPLLVVVTGGAGLDAQELGDLFAVLVVDGGAVKVEGTTIHGAVFASETLDLGASGRVSFCRRVLRWATDRSLSRARLVPGARWEVTD